VRAIFDATRQDLSYAWRVVRRSPGFTFFATLTIALGLGANAAIFSLVDGVLLKSMSYPEPERIVQLWEKPPRGLRNGISAANYIDWTQQSQSFEAMAAQTGATMSYAASSATVRAETCPGPFVWRPCRHHTSTSSARRRHTDGRSPGTKIDQAARRLR
jgi:MacB-like periplasmic core domain